MKQVYRELKKPEVKARFKNIAVDTVDLLATYCEKYICNQNDIDSLGQLPYGHGWSLFKKEFEEVFRGLSQLGYGIVLLGHHKETISEDGSTKIIRPALANSVKTIVTGLADVYGYAYQKELGKPSYLKLRDSSGQVECGNRFRYMTEEIPFSYDELVKELNRAIDMEATEKNGQFVTDEKEKIVQQTTYDFEALMNEFQELTSQLMNKNQNNALKITAIAEKYLGKGKKVGECTPNQAEHLDLIITDLKELLN